METTSPAMGAVIFVYPRLAFVVSTAADAS